MTERRFHVYDGMTGFCIGCGVAAQLAVEKSSYECVDTTNVIAVSHIIMRRRLGAAVNWYDT